MIEKKAKTEVEINSLLASRWSGRAYDPDKLVDPKQIVSLCEAARWAPSCFGDQPWRYIICNRTTDSQAWEKALNCLVEGNQQWAKKAPILIAVLANTKFSHNDADNRWGAYDTGAASMSICVQATELGLMVHQMGGFDAEKLSHDFEVPETFTPMSMMAIGYQVDVDGVADDMVEKEMADRQRSPLKELFFSGTWGESI